MIGMVLIYNSNSRHVCHGLASARDYATNHKMVELTDTNEFAPRHPAGGCAMSCPYTRNHFGLGGSSLGGVQTRSKFPGWGTNGRHSPGKKTHWYNCPAIMETVISLSVAWIGVFSGSDMSSTFDKAAYRQFIHAKYPGREGDGQFMIFAFVALKH